jgi:drug/metabolite transporter (DMT)-like permease
MVGSATVGSHGPAAVAGGVAVIAVGVGMAFRPAATLAVLLTVLTIGLSNPSQLLAALSGLCAAAYLVCRHAAGAPAAGAGPTMVAAVGFMFAGLVATSFPLQVPWLPLAAPLAVLAIYVLATRPFLG